MNDLEAGLDAGLRTLLAGGTGLAVLCDVRNQVGESPLWSVAEQALYWVDIEGQRVHRFDWAARTTQFWPTAERIGCIALHAEGGLLAAMESGLFRLQRSGDPGLSATLLCAVQFPKPQMRFNDGRTDRAGRFWVTSMVRNMSPPDAAGALFRCEAQGAAPPLVTSVVSGLVTGNGLGFSPDGRTLYLSDSNPAVQKVWAFDLDDDGVPNNRREFIDFTAYPGRPDGAAVDAEGAYWICANDAGLVHRFLPDGRLDRSITVPAAKPSMCAFGGPGLDWLFITSITPGAPIEGYDAALAGAVFVVRPGVRGLAERAFG